MAGDRRARADQVARRLNAAAELLASGCDVAKAARQLAGRHQISERQARRYVELARDRGPVEVPRAKIVFTLKLPIDLVRRVRKQARRGGQTISGLVTLALTEFLDRLRAGSRDG